MLMGPIDVTYVGTAVPPPLVTFDLYHAPPTLTLAHPNPSTSVNDHGPIEGSVRLEGSLSACEGCVQMVLLHPPRKWVVSLRSGWGGKVLTSLCVLRLCCVSGNVCGLPVGFRRSVKF